MTYKKPTTAAEKDTARQAAQTVTAELMQRVSDRIEVLADQLQRGASEDLLAFLRFSGRFHFYSANNQLLIEAQAPEARHVAGFHAWKALGRSVKKGAKALRILAPLIVPDREAPPQADGRPAQKIAGFTYSSVFADFDTEGDPMPDDAFMVVQGGDDQTRALLSELTPAAPVPVVWDDRENPAHGWTDGGQIVLNTQRCQLDPAHALRVFFHEWAHVELHFQGQHQRPEQLPTRAVRELEADAAAYVLAHLHGVDAAVQVSDYLTTWGGQPEALRGSLTRIGRAVSAVIAQVEKRRTELSAPQAAD